MKIDMNKVIKTEPKMIKEGVNGPSLLVTLLIVIVLLFGLSSCSNSDPILDSHEYTITDTTYVSRSGFNQVLSYRVILFNHYDSSYHSGDISPRGELFDYNPRPIKTLK
jgi:hypothetical protein